MNNEPQSTAVTIGEVRLSYANIWEPRAQEGGGEPKYSCALLFAKNDAKIVAQVQAAISAAMAQGKAKFGNTWKPGPTKTGVRDGDTEREGDETYKGMFFINANNKQQPGIFNRQRQPVIDQNEVYSGCYAYVSVNFFPYKHPTGGNGIGVGLNHIMKVKDGEPLSARVTADEAFKGIDFGTDAAATPAATNGMFGGIFGA